MGAVPEAVPRAVPPAAGGLAVNAAAQRRPYQPMTGKPVITSVPRPEGDSPQETPWQPAYATAGATGRTLAGGSAGAPSVPTEGFLFKAGAIDPHYAVMSGRNPYATVNSPPTRGFTTWVKAFANHVFQGRQNVDAAGWQQAAPQQRTSWMRVTPPALGPGYAPEAYVPRQLPQQPNTYRYGPVTGTSEPGVVPGQGIVLNSSAYGAGQVAGGIGGNAYTPSPPPPDTVQAVPAASSGMPSWG